MVLTSRFEEALVYATQLHSRQIRKGSGVPYISHLLGVCSLALEYGADENEAIAALLHDAVEDQGGLPRLEEIRAKFGDKVADIVLGCSDSDSVPKPPWQQRKETYLAHLQKASPSILLVSACDKLYNARSILADYRNMGEEIWWRFKGGRQGTLWYYRQLVLAFRKLSTPPHLIDELELVVSELENLT